MWNFHNWPSFARGATQFQTKLLPGCQIRPISSVNAIKGDAMNEVQ